MNCTITAANLTKGDIWAVNMTATDGTINSTLRASAEVTVEDVKESQMKVAGRDVIVVRDNDMPDAAGLHSEKIQNPLVGSLSAF